MPQRHPRATRADYGPNRLSLRLAFRPFVDAFEFQGRSTRREVISFWLLGALGNLHLGTLTVEGIPPQLSAILGIAWAILWGWPWFPLLVRRLHDQDRSGRWALLPLLIVPILALAWFTVRPGHWLSLNLDIGSLHQSREIAATGWSVFLFLISIALGLVANFLFLLWRPTIGRNRFGPDPRGESISIGDAALVET
jgi:uncharacterized membrane protein YhaH (DUF805 family)